MPRVVFRTHAVDRMIVRRVSVEDVVGVLASGEVIEDYPTDQPLGSRLILGFVRLRPLHIVAAYDQATDEEVIITVYEPDPALWGPGFRERLP